MSWSLSGITVYAEIYSIALVNWNVSGLLYMQRPRRVSLIKAGTRCASQDQVQQVRDLQRRIVLQGSVATLSALLLRQAPIISLNATDVCPYASQKPDLH